MEKEKICRKRREILRQTKRNLYQITKEMIKRKENLGEPVDRVSIYNSINKNLRKIYQTIFPKKIDKNPDAKIKGNIELLTEIGFDESISKSISKKYSDLEIFKRYVSLEEVIKIDDTVKKTIRKVPELLVMSDYKFQKTLDIFKKLTYYQITKLDKEIGTNLKLLENYGKYKYRPDETSLDSNPKTEKKLDFSNLNLGEYRILHTNNEKSVLYLNSLIEEGTLKLGEHEHWSKSKNKGTGPRGVKIAKVIDQQIKQLFNELDLEPPKNKIEFGESTLTIAEETQERLEKIRKEIYKAKLT